MCPQTYSCRLALHKICFLFLCCLIPHFSIRWVGSPLLLTACVIMKVSIVHSSALNSLVGSNSWLQRVLPSVSMLIMEWTLIIMGLIQPPIPIQVFCSGNRLNVNNWNRHLWLYKFLTELFLKSIKLLSYLAIKFSKANYTLTTATPNICIEIKLFQS